MPRKTSISSWSVRPLGFTEQQERDRLDAVRMRVISAWKAKVEKRNNGEALPEPPECYLARKIYEYLCKMVQPHGGWRILERIIEQSRSLDTGRYPIRGKPFKLGIVFFLGAEEGISKNCRSEWSDAMRYAYMHSVEPRNYVGFVKQVGLKRIRAKLENKDTVPGFNRSQMRDCP